MIGDRSTAALVGSNGSIDWLCLPRFDSPACFAALLGDEENGRWQLCPVGDYQVSRAYVENSAALQTTFSTDTGVVTLLDVMPTGNGRIDLVRRVTGVRGTVRMHHEWVVRFEYGTARPWIRRRLEDSDEPAITAVAGPDKLVLRGARLPEASGNRHVDDFDVREGDILTFSTTWLPSHFRTPGPHPALVDETIHDEVTWVARLDLTDVPHADVVRRSLLTLHLMTHIDTGGIVAAPTTSLPEDFGGERNWDYRYCWLRDAALTINSLIEAGATEEARFWRDWLLRAVAGDPADLQIMYAVDGVAAAHRADHRRPAGLRRVASGPHRQRRGRPAADRRHRRGDARPRGRARVRPGAERRHLEPSAGADRPPRRDLAGPRQRALGDPRPAAALHPLAGDGVGRVRPCGGGGRAARARGRRRPLARPARPGT